MSAMRGERGFSIVSILTGLLLTSVLMASAFTMLTTHTKTYNQQDLAMAMEQNLRVAVDQVGDALRSAGSAAPSADLTAWIPWVTGFDTNPHIAGSPARLSVARCTSFPVAVLSAPAAAGAVTLSVDSNVAGQGLAELLDTEARRLIAIDDVENAHLTLVGSSLIEIDTDPTVAGAQGLSRGFAAGTPICRVDVTTFGISTDGAGTTHLFRDLNQGRGPEPYADAIADLRIVPLEPGRVFEISLTGQSHGVDPLSEAPLQRTLTSIVAVRNAG